MENLAEKAKMRTLTTGRCNCGFTLLELLVVLFILSMSVSLSLPALMRLGENKVESESKRLASTLRYLSDNAISTKETFVLKINIREKTLTYRNLIKEKSVIFENLTGIELQSKGLVSSGEVLIFFGHSGPSEAAIFYLGKERKRTRVLLNPLSGTVKITQLELKNQQVLR